MSIVEMTPEQLRHFIQHHHEKEFVVNDVRQPGEYEHGHIPGARLILLPELVRAMESLPQNQELVFCCRSGGRSQAAAAMVADEKIAGKPLLFISWHSGRLTGVCSGY